MHVSLTTNVFTNMCKTEKLSSGLNQPEIQCETVRQRKDKQTVSRF